MTDYAAAAVQKIAQALVAPIALSAPGSAQTLIAQRGFLNVVRTVGGAAAGDFTFTLDPGLPGDVSLDPLFARTNITLRGLGVGGAAPVSVLPFAVTYPSFTTVRVVFGLVNAQSDPDEFEIVVNRAM